MRRLLGPILVGVGAFALVMAALLKFYVYPSLSVAPADQSSVSTSFGEQMTYFDVGTRTELDALGHVGVVATGVDVDLVPQPTELACQRRDVDVLSAGVDAAQDGQWTRVLGHHGDLHSATSLRIWSQSARKRSRP